MAVMMLALLSMLYLLGVRRCEGKYHCESPILLDGGDVITSSDSSYDSIRFDQWAASRDSIEKRNENLSPTLIVIPKTEKEIKSVIKFAKKCDYTISIKSGGHQYSALSSCNGGNGQCIQIIMDNFDHISHNTDNNGKVTTIIAGSGAKLVDLARENHLYNVAVLMGTCPTVGVGGHYQSSAQSAYARSLGLGMDWIIRVKIITADGKTRNLYKNSKKKKDRDLFWAILGGSPGSWGVVIEYEFEPIRNDDYPHSHFYSYAHFYSKPGFEAFLRYFFKVFNNPYFYNNNDLLAAFVGSPMITVPGDASSIIGTGIMFNFYWTGIDHGDIKSVIPGHPENKTWYQEFIEPFKAIDSMFAMTALNQFKYEGPMTISGCLFIRAAANTDLVVPTLRYINSHSGYTKKALDELFSDTTKTEEWIQSIVNKMDEAAADPTDNIEMSFQFLPLMRNPGKITDDILINTDPLKNAISWPLRDIALESDDWICFGEQDEYSPDKLIKAKQFRDDFEQIMSGNQIKSHIKSYAYTDLNADEYDINIQWNQFYNDRQDVYVKLQEIKTRIDCKNIFKGPLTIPPKRMCDSADDSDSYDYTPPLQHRNFIRFDLSSPWIWVGFGLLFIVILSFNICVFFNYYKGNLEGKGYLSVKRIHSDVYDSENNELVNNNDNNE